MVQTPQKSEVVRLDEKIRPNYMHPIRNTFCKDVIG